MKKKLARLTRGTTPARKATAVVTTTRSLLLFRKNRRGSWRWRPEQGGAFIFAMNGGPSAPPSYLGPFCNHFYHLRTYVHP